MINDNQKIEEDVNDDTWEWYKKIYRGKGRLSDYFDLDNPIIKNKRKYAMIRKNVSLDDNAKKMQISGDIIFNFSSKGFKGQSRYDILKKYIKEIEEDVLRDVYITKLNNCCKYNYNIENCALIPKQGNLQNAKQGIGNDRGDTFIWALDEYFENGVEILLNHGTYENKKILKSFLETIRKPGKHESTYNYCKLFFNITDKRLIDDLIELGSKTIDSELRARRYIDLALKFWEKRKEFAESIKVNDSKKK